MGMLEDFTYITPRELEIEELNRQHPSKSDICLGKVCLGQNVLGEKEKTHFLSVLMTPRKVLSVWHTIYWSTRQCSYSLLKANYKTFAKLEKSYQNLLFLVYAWCRSISVIKTSNSIYAIYIMLRKLFTKICGLSK